MSANTNSNDGIICPYCGYVHEEYWDYLETGDMEGEFVLDCENCLRQCNVSFVTHIEFTSSGISNPSYDRERILDELSDLDAKSELYNCNVNIEEEN